jgi:CRISPR/Cas system CSM-associated protein Csm3 (group 7 of RAMP superfamily)
MKYKISFFDYWHLSSGVSAGSALDTLVVKDPDGIAYLPGKTIKGVLREMAELLDSAKTDKVFGCEGANMANSYFSNATLDEDTRNYLANNKKLIKNLYSKVTSTKLDENSQAIDGSLREIEVVIPLTLYGEIVSDEDELITRAMGMVKQIGLNRNRGLGRCQMEVIK